MTNLKVVIVIIGLLGPILLNVPVKEKKENVDWRNVTNLFVFVQFRKYFF